MADRRYENFKMNFPSMAEHVIFYEPYGDWSITVQLDDGTCVMYDDFTQTFRTLPEDSRNLSEDECRIEFGLRLKKVMKLKHVTQKDLASMTGIDECSVSSYINGKRSPSFYRVDKIAKALNCSVDEFRYI